MILSIDIFYFKTVIIGGPIKAHSLNSRLFKHLCSKNDEEFERLLLHTEVRWLSKGICLNRVFCNFS